MKKLLAICAIVAFGFQSFAQSELPTTDVKDMRGANVPFNQTIEKGKVTIVSFWATWCIPCKKEIKIISQKLPDWKNQADINYMTVSVDESKATAMVRSYAKSQGWDFPAYQDANSDLKRSLNFQNVPFTIIIDKEGKVAYMHSGFEEGGEDEVFAKAKELAAK